MARCQVLLVCRWCRANLWLGRRIDRGAADVEKTPARRQFTLAVGTSQDHGSAAFQAEAGVGWVFSSAGGAAHWLPSQSGLPNLLATLDRRECNNARAGQSARGMSCWRLIAKSQKLSLYSLQWGEAEQQSFDANAVAELDSNLDVAGIRLPTGDHTFAKGGVAH